MKVERIRRKIIIIAITITITFICIVIMAERLENYLIKPVSIAYYEAKYEGEKAWFETIVQNGGINVLDIPEEVEEIYMSKDNNGNYVIEYNYEHSELIPWSNKHTKLTLSSKGQIISQNVDFTSKDSYVDSCIDEKGDKTTIIFILSGIMIIIFGIILIR